MYTSLEHDYIGLSEVEKKKKNTSSSTSVSTTDENEKKKKNNVLNLKETELRLGLPGSESPERKSAGTVGGKGLVEDYSSSFGLVKNFVHNGKRGFSDAIDVSGKWVFSGNGGGSEVDLGKGAVLFSPRCGNGGKPLGGIENINTTHQQQSGSAPTEALHQNPNPSSQEKKKPQISSANDQAPPAKTQVVGWPPIRSFRKNTMVTNPSKNNDDNEGKSECLYVKVSMDGAPYLRKVDLKTYSNYVELSSALEKMFSCFTIGQCNSNGVPSRNGMSESRLRDLLHGSDCVLTYEDKDGDWMLVGDVPWDMFIDSCKRLRIMKGSEAIGLAPRPMEKCKNRN